MTETLEPTTVTTDLDVATPPSVEVLQEQVRTLETNVERLQEQLHTSDEQRRQAEQRHRDDIALIGETLIEEANRRDWCGQYDEAVDSLNESLSVQLPLRERDYTVAVPVTIYIQVTACGDEEAAQEAGEIANQIETRVDSMDGVRDSHFGSTDDYSISRYDD